MRWTLPGEKLRILPVPALRALAVSLVVVLLAVLIVERAVLPRLEDRGVLAAGGWIRHNQLLNDNTTRKFKPTLVDPLLRTPAWPVAAERRKPVRVLVMGDSFVWGSLTNINDLWWRQLEQTLEDRGYGGVEVLAAGVGGASTRDQLDMARRIAPLLRPDLIVWGYVTNDADERIVRQHETVRFGPMVDRLTRVAPNLTYALVDRHAKRVAAAGSGSERGFEYFDWELEILRGENFARYQATVTELGAWCRAQSVPCLAVSLPNAPSKAFFAARIDPVKPVWDAAGVPFVDLLARFVSVAGDADTAAARMRFGVNPADAHPGPRATCELARAAADAMLTAAPALFQAGRAPPPDGVLNDWLPADLAFEGEGDAFTFRWPEGSPLLLEMPLRDPWVMFSFSRPLALDRIRLNAPGLARAQIHLTVAATSAEPCHDGGIISFSPQSAAHREWELDGPIGARITSIRITADVDDATQPITLVLSRWGAR